ncbi:hypothetical protein [Aquimarina algiphila]|uniref:Nuclear transport factor 2 family protein n=1 Tax=Aquimarina algiphila TaxID=2047982 RepID=A0A554VIB3_9FLAO|nr:hypothetical protein [Aquimarina algiphila]TSE07400.1 hypothetical protein FOF46_15900 [Aquimarina algiphila]
MKISHFSLLIIMLFLSKLIFAQNQDVDRKEIDEVISDLYKSISFDKGGAPDLDKLTSIHHAEAMVGAVDTSKVRMFTEKEFRAANKKAFEKNNIISFQEKEINAITHVYGGVAMRFSTYEFTIKREGKERTIRGVNTIQLIKDPKNGWLIYSVIFSDNRSYSDLPSIYLKE